jgi:hypothetical protein
VSKWQVAFLRAALGWLVATGVLGVVVSIWPALAGPFRPTHAHMGVLGFFLGMVMGVAFWMLPRPGGIKQTSWEAASFVLLQAGLVLRVVVEPWWRMTGDRNVQVAFVVSGLLLLAAMVVFLLAMSKRVVTLATIREKGLGRRRAAAPQEGESGEKD